MLHQRDRERSGRDRVSARTSRDHAHEAACRYRSLSRSSLALSGEPTARSIKNWPAPEVLRNEPKRTKRNMNEAETPAAPPNIPSVLRYMNGASSSNEKPACQDAGHIRPEYPVSEGKRRDYRKGPSQGLRAPSMTSTIILRQDICQTGSQSLRGPRSLHSSAVCLHSIRL